MRQVEVEVRPLRRCQNRLSAGILLKDQRLRGKAAGLRQDQPQRCMAANETLAIRNAEEAIGPRAFLWREPGEKPRLIGRDGCQIDQPDGNLTIHPDKRRAPIGTEQIGGSWIVGDGSNCFDGRQSPGLSARSEPPGRSYQGAAHAERCELPAIRSGVDVAPGLREPFGESAAQLLQGTVLDLPHPLL